METSRLAFVRYRFFVFPRRMCFWSWMIVRGLLADKQTPRASYLYLTLTAADVSALPVDFYVAAVVWYVVFVAFPPSGQRCSSTRVGLDCADALRTDE